MWYLIALVFVLSIVAVRMVWLYFVEWMWERKQDEVNRRK